MVDLENILTIARKELYDALRNRWFLLFTLAFIVLALALSLLGQPTGGQLRLANYSRTTASLVNLVLLFVPLIGLTLGSAALASDRETGALEYLLAQPVTHTEVLLGKYAGLAGALLASLLLGFGVAGGVLITQNQTSDAWGYALTVALACLLALAMLSVGFLISAIAQKTATALGGGLFVWLFLVFAGDLGLMGTAIITRLPIEAVFYTASVNPLQMFKLATILNLQASLEVLGPVGLYAMEQFGTGLFAILLVGLVLWIVIPLAAAAALFATGRLLPLPRVTRMKTAAALSLVVLLVVACTSSGEATEPIVDDVDMALAVEPDPPAVGEATLVITLTDSDGAPIDGATIQVHGDMDHEGMTPVDGETATSEAGVYRVPFEWTMGGGWLLDVTATLPNGGGVVRRQFEVNVSAISRDSAIRQHDSDAAQRDLAAIAARDVQIDYQPLTDPVTIGESTVVVTVTKADGEPIDDAQVTLTGTMNHAGMMPIHGEASGGDGGQYHIPIQWTMAGEWHIEIQVTLTDGTQVTATFEQHVTDANDANDDGNDGTETTGSRE